MGVYTIDAPAPERSPSARGPRRDAGRRVVLRDGGWQGDRAILSIRGEKSNPRIAHGEGGRARRSSSRGHEGVPAGARASEARAREVDIARDGRGSGTRERREIAPARPAPPAGA